MDEAEPAWGEERWASWPHLNISMDLGPDGVCGVHALQRNPKQMANVACWLDPGHGIHKDFDGALRSVNMQSFWLVYAISLNLQGASALPTTTGDDGLGVRAAQLAVMPLV